MARLSSLTAHVVVALALLVSTQGALLVSGLFQIRQEWIVEHQCENRNHPERRCNGTCVLRRHLEEHDGHGDHGEPEAVPIAPVGIALLAPETTVPPDRWRNAATPGSEDDRRPGGGVDGEVFRPPRA